MKEIKCLDCTLRDGGYINNWEFGYDTICDIIKNLENTNVDFLEIGFLKNENYNKNRTVFNSIKQIKDLIPNKANNILYAAMIEVENPIPLELLEERCLNGIDIIRVIIWKNRINDSGIEVDALEEGFEYCKEIVKKGYKLCIQPARVEQYTDDEFINMLKMFQQLSPLAFYVVDSWGTLFSDKILHYVELADKNLDKNIAIGYHGHNNLMQAFGTAVEFVHKDIDRTLIVDASIYGIGRGAGNLNMEIFANYLNETEGKNYKVMPMLYIYEKYIKEIYKTKKWGYSLPYYLSAIHHCNPNYGLYYGMEMNLNLTDIDNILANLSDKDKILFNKKITTDMINCI